MSLLRRFALVVVASASCVGDGDGQGGEGGEGASPPPNVIVQSAGDDMVRMIVTNAPIDCEFSGSLFEVLDECGSFAIEVRFPADRLRAGPLIPTDEVSVVRVSSADGGGSCDGLGIGGSPQGSGTVVIESVTEETIEVRLDGFDADIDGDGAIDSPINGFHAGVRCDTPPEP